MNFTILIPVYIAVGLAGAGIGYLIGLLTEHGERNELRRRVFGFTTAVLFILAGIPLFGWIVSQVN